MTTGTLTVFKRPIPLFLHKDGVTLELAACFVWKCMYDEYIPLILSEQRQPLWQISRNSNLLLQIVKFYTVEEGCYIS